MIKINKIKVCNEYINNLKDIKNLSESSVRVYTSTIKEFSKYTFTKDGLNKYMIGIKSQKANTKARKITIVKNFLNYLYENKYIKEKFWNNLKAPREQLLPKFLTKQEIQAIINNSNEPYCYIYDFLAKTGLRISELYNLSFQKLDNNYILKIKGKGNKERNLKINNKIYELYLKFKDEIPAKRTLQRNIKKAALKANINKNVSLHTLRHSFAINCINKNIPINIIQAILGHNNLNTTSIYTKVSSDEITLE